MIETPLETSVIEFEQKEMSDSNKLASAIDMLSSKKDQKSVSKDASKDLILNNSENGDRNLNFDKIIMDKSKEDQLTNQIKTNEHQLNKFSNKSTNQQMTTSDQSNSQQTHKSSDQIYKQTNQNYNDQPDSTLKLSDHIKNKQLFGPFDDPIQWLVIRHPTTKHNLPKEFSSLEPDLLTLFRSIEIANSIDEQNMEIIVKNNKFYFRAMQTIELDSKSRRDNQNTDNSDIKGNENVLDDNKTEKNINKNTNSDTNDEGPNEDTNKGIDSENSNKITCKESDDSASIESPKKIPLFAWFSSELSSRLPTPSESIINGNKRYYCTKCNQIFINPNPTILHILFGCPSNSLNMANTLSESNLASVNTSSLSSSPFNASSNTTNSNEYLASPSDKLDNNKTSLSIGSNNISINTSINNSINSVLNRSSSNSSLNSRSSNCIDTSYTPLNGSLSLANSKILKNLEAKLCKQFNSQQNISTDTLLSANSMLPINASLINTPSFNTSPNKSSNKSLVGHSKSSNKQPKKRAFDIDSLVNNIEHQTTPQNTKKHKSNLDPDHPSPKSSAKNNKGENSKLFKIPSSTISSSTKTNDSLTNSTLINTLNSPLVNNSLINAGNNGLVNSSFLNPFSLLDPTSLASNLPSAFHKIDHCPSSSNKSSSLLNNSNLTPAEHANLLNAAAMFGVTASPLANPFDLAALYAQHQRNLLQSMFNSSQTQTNQLSNSSSASSSGLNNYIQNQLTNPLFASQNLANLSTLNSLNNFNNFNGLNSLLMNQSNSPINSSLPSSLTSNLNSSLNSNLASSLTSGIPPSLASSLFGQINQTHQNMLNQSTNQQFNSLESFVMPQTTNTEKNHTTTKKKKTKNKDLNNNNQLNMSNMHSSQSNTSSTNHPSNRNSSLSSSSLSTINHLNQTDSSKLSSLIPPSYLQFLPPSLAALSHPQSNWCAKCNLSFRMTSDLVYHMRSQHKESNGGSIDGQSSSPKRKKDENKLICSICGETFKERHHLSRHLVSH